MPAAFKIPDIQDNDDGWGPGPSVPNHLEGVPYAPFSKGDKVGRVSDFTGQGFNKFGGRYGQRDAQPGVAVFNFFHNEEEDSFHLVDNRPTQKNRGQRRFGPNRFQQARRDAQARGEPPEQKGHQPRQKASQKRQFQQYQRYDNRGQVVYTSSVDIRPEWTVVEQIPFTALHKLNYSVAEPEDVAFCGALEYYDKTYDRVTPKTERPLKRTQRVFHPVTTSEDPVMQRLAGEGKARVFATDAILTTLMCSPRSVYSWDIVLVRRGDQLFLDKRPQSALDLVTVAETAPEPVLEEKDNINGVQHLSVEATNINRNFSQQVLQQEAERWQAGEPSPFSAPQGEASAAVAYRYRRWELSEELPLVVRSEVDGCQDAKGQQQLLSIKALNEFDPKMTGVDWRQKIENQRGAVLATELKNNGNKLAKWTAAALIAGVDLIKLGYVSRSHPKDPTNHTILSTQAVKPKDFAAQINLNMDNCWGIVRAVVDLCLAQEDGKYLLTKDPNKQLLRLYRVPADAFEQNYSEEPLPENEEAPEAPDDLPAVKPEGDDKEKDDDED